MEIWLALLLAVAPTPQGPEGLLQLAVQEENQGQWERALEHFEQADAALVEARRWEDSVLVNSHMASCWRGLDDPEAEHAAYQQAWRRLEEHVQSEAFLVAVAPMLRADISDCQRRLGSFAEAEQSARTAVRLAEEPGAGPDALGFALFKLGLVQMESGRSAEALDSLRRALEEHPAGHPQRIWVRSSYGNCLLQLGDFEGSLAVHAEILAELRAAPAGRELELAEELKNNAYALVLLGRMGAAEGDLREAIALSERAGLEDTDLMVRGLLAFVLCSLGELDEAVVLTEQTVTLRAERSRGRDHPAMVYDFTQRGNALRAKGLEDDDPELLEQASAAYGRAVDIARRTGSGELSYALALLAEHLLEDMDQPERAVELATESVAVVERLRERAIALGDIELQARHVGVLRRYDPYLGLVRALVRLERPAEAVEVLESARARGLLDLLQQSRLDALAEARRTALAGGDELEVERIDQLELRRDTLRERALVLERRVLDGEAGDELEAELADVRERSRALDQERARRVQQHVSLARPLPVETIRELLREGERLLYYALDRDEGFAFVVPPPGEPVVCVRLTDEAGRAPDLAAIADAVVSYRRAMLSESGVVPARGEGLGGGGARRSSIAAGHRLFRTLLPPALWVDLREASTVYVVPHGPLHLLPFESLVVEPGEDHASARYWLDVGPDLVYGASGSVLAWCRDRRREQSSEEPLRDVVVVADPSMEGPGLSLEPLPGARREGEAIRAASEREPDAPGEVHVLVGAEASETRLFELAGGARWLHVATHQITGRAGDTTGRLVLAQVDEPTLRDDGFVDLDDLLQRWRGRLSGCELVVLSACGSALGTQVAGEEILGLPWGLHYAGAPAVLASLWPVSDTATAELMAELYGSLAATAGATRVRSFTEARRALRRDWPAPYYWAPFVWNGTPR